MELVVISIGNIFVIFVMTITNIRLDDIN